MKSLKIFLAEDNPGDVELVREALREHSILYHLFLATDGTEVRHFIERLGTDPKTPCPDLLLLDLNLPKADGHELFALFRAHPLCVHTPVIVVTSSNAQVDRDRAAALGAADFFRKPADLTEFLKLGLVIRQVAASRGLLQSA